jgi:putative methionine-R-sulfoxide reductase with GAF domain
LGTARRAAEPGVPSDAGLTGATTAEHRTITVGDVRANSRYLTAPERTRSEIIVPVFRAERAGVAATLDIERASLDAFGDEEQSALESCAATIRPV